VANTLKLFRNGAVGFIDLLGCRHRVPYVDSAAPFTIGFSTPDSDGPARGCSRFSVSALHCHCIVAKHVSKILIR
jgi:hypothetical protein